MTTLSQDAASVTGKDAWTNAQSGAVLHGEHIDAQLEVLAVADIGIDYRYQREPNLRRVKKIADAWDMALCGFIDVNVRPDGSYWVIDGQHRLLAARQSREQQILCFIHRKQTVEEEAAFFHLKDKNKASLGSLANMRALWTAGDPQIRAIVASVERCGYHLASAQGRPGSAARPTDIAAATALWDLSRWSTKNRNDPRLGTPNLQRLESALRLIKATWPDVPGAVSSEILHGVDLVLRTYGPELDQGRFVTKLGKLSPSRIISDSRGVFATDKSTDRHTWTAIAMVKAYNYKAVTNRLEIGRLFGDHSIVAGARKPMGGAMPKEPADHEEDV